MKKKYVCWSGHVRSAADGQIHFVSAYRLPGLYGISPDECYFASMEDSETTAGRDFAGLMSLFPDSSGEYKLPARKVK